MSKPTINLEHALPIRCSDQGYAVHVAIIGGTWAPCTHWRPTFAEALTDRNNMIAALDEEAA